MKTEVRNITPKIAEQLLDLNKLNRRIKESTISAYVKQMKAGKWRLTGESIKISNSKILLDGQHRLLAVVRSGATVPMLVISELEDEIFNVLDTGSLRTAGDVLSIAGIESPALSAASARFVLNYNKGCYTSKSNNKADKPTNSEIQSFVEANPEIIEYADYIFKNAKKFKLLGTSVLAGMYFILSKISVTDSEKYMQKLIFGIDLQENCPIRLYRERLIRDQINKSKLPMKEKVSLMVNSWNHFRKDTSVKQLRSVKQSNIQAR